MESPILVVGAGGIGCELLKNLVMTGFCIITVVDLDRIDLSNLNRQFLFRRNHLGMYKAEVACAQLTVMRPDLKLTPVTVNIKSLPLSFFRPFAFIFSALDNLEARRHVNRVCVTLKIPMIEAGTTGYNGQVAVHFPPHSQCFECEPKPTPKTYPVCTIRTTPDKPVHCIVWAKYLYELMFCGDDESNLLSDLKRSLPSEPDALLHKLFIDDINELNALDQKTTRRVIELEIDSNLPKPHEIPTVSQLVGIFKSSVQALQYRGQVESFDKDDALAMEFVVSAANLRAHNYDINLLTAFAIKEIAGNIIPAVASTNSIAAGLQVSEAYKLVSGAADLKNIWISEILRNKKFVVGGSMPKPSLKCYTCGKKEVEATLNLQETTLLTLVNEVLKGQVSMQQPSVEFKCRTLYETGDDLDSEDEANFELLGSRTLSSLGIVDSSYLRCVDQSTDLCVTLLVLDVNAPQAKRPSSQEELPLKISTLNEETSGVDCLE